MKYSQLLTVLAAASAVAAAPHAEAHAHHPHKRDIKVEYVYVTVTVDADGKAVTATEIGTSNIPDPVPSSSVVVSSSAAAVPTSSSVAVASSSAAPSSAAPSSAAPSSAAPSSSSAVVAAPSSTKVASSSAVVVPSSSSSSVVAASSSSSSKVVSSSASASSAPASSSTLAVATSSVAASSSAASSSAAASSSTSAAKSSSSGSSSSSSSSGSLSPYADITTEFKDGVYSCDEFPSSQPGVVSLDYLGFGGWSGIYHSDTSTGGSCTEGAYCSYACQAGMSKTQWPSTQPGNGVSVGGLLCKGGKLYRSNTASNTLCEWGIDSAVVVSELDQVVSICRTDYPGTENMVVPTIVQGGSSEPLCVVDQNNYYVWQGKPTSAQYYVNNAGVSQTKGCIWGSDGSGVGNWAPLNFGAGYVDGITYLSLIPNPNNLGKANFNVKIVAESGASVNGECVYENGSYTGGSNGCTVAVTKGRAKFVLYN